MRSAEVSVPRGGLNLTAVLSALASARGPAKLEEVRAKVGGSVAQVRSALQKLATAGMLEIAGERRGTRYLARR
jgi:predicted transcriptional regulator